MIPAADVAVVVGIALASSGAVSAAGALVLRGVRSRSTTTGLVSVVLIALLAVVLGVAATAAFMFVSPHDLQVLLMVVAVTGSVGLGAALLLGRAVVAGSSALGRSAAGLGEPGYRPVERPLPSELAALDRQLAARDEELRRSRERERALEATRRELVAGVSHDLRTPLAGIRAMAEALGDGVVNGPEGVAAYSLRIRRETERLSAMVDDLFELARINSGALQLTPTDSSLAELVDDAVDSTRPVADAAGVTLVVHPDGALPTVRVSPAELSRALHNLLANAVRHTPAGGAVQVRLVQSDGGVEVAVQDACGGVPEQDLPRVFDPGFRGSTARTPGAGGGLGLAVARGLVEAHDGTVTLVNSPPGCRAVLRLPQPRR